ncbi:MAG: hypothetical protein IKS87_02270, partial [Lachnospiraceae bacterium]|nr:hypothetical protein [Lachnospiraceae bacterium]
MQNDREIKNRRKRFAALILTVLVGVLPATTVWAAPINYEFSDTLVDQDVPALINRTIAPGENFHYQFIGTGGLQVTYAPAGAGTDYASGWGCSGTPYQIDY